jgi:hypothetical protein
MAQFMFGSSVATVYAVLMEFNVVYDMFFATAIVCFARGMGWWVAHLYQKNKKKRLGAGSPLLNGVPSPALNGAASR